jgi:serine/threonine protein kinase/tetratricopeptide (TPR) repeat protein
MKHFSPGFSDSIASVIAHPTPCPHCESSSNISGGLCVGCLLQTGLEPDDACASETLGSVLSEITIADKNWRLGNYEILEESGRGGMGVIYRARQRHSRRIVAVKRVLSYHADSQETLARFRREAQAAASLDHPNILPIYEVSESEDGLPFFSMKFAPGGSLQEVGPALKNEPRQCVALVAKVARAVQYAHGKGILHRDLKPGNILLDGRGEPLVSDFGLAKWLDTTSDLTRTLTIFGTPGYIAPEQASGSAAQLKPAADVYSLGAILFDLLAGRPPFLGSHALSVIRQAAENPAPKLRSLSKVADRDLETICARCLERDPSARYRSAHDLAEDLERWLEGRPILARRVLPPMRVWRWSKRNPKLVASIAACLLASSAAAIWQIQSRHLAATVREEQLAAHSIAVLPFLDLDEIGPDLKLTSNVEDILQRETAKLGPSEIRPINKMLRRWTGAGIHNEVEEAATITRARGVLTGTRRQVRGGTRISLHLFSANGSSVLGDWLLEENSVDSFQRLARSIYSALEKDPMAARPQDPVMLNERAHALFTTGCDLLIRRTFTDVDRAISCLEGAVREEPQSIVARAYLAMAYVGMDFQTSRPELMQKALRFAREAVELAPRDPTANRSLYVAYVTYGKYEEAREYALRALEFGDRSERAFGQIAFSWHMAGRPDKAIKWYEKAKVSQQQPADYENYLGDCWTDLGRDDLAQAAYQAAANIRPDHPDGWIGLCRLKILTRDWPGAREICRAQLEQYTGSPEPKEIAATTEFFARNYDAAQRLYTELAKAAPLGGGRDMALGTVDYRSALARLKIEGKDRPGAFDLLRECVGSQKSRLSFAPNDMTALYGLAAAEAMLGQTEASLKDLRAAIDSGWVDYRATVLDPRFDTLRELPEFKKIISELAYHMAELRTAFTGRSQVVSKN